MVGKEIIIYVKQQIYFNAQNTNNVKKQASDEYVRTVTRKVTNAFLATTTTKLAVFMYLIYMMSHLIYIHFPF